MKQFHSNLLYLVLGIVIGKLVLSTDIPAPNAICIVIFLVIYTFYSSVIVDYLRTKNQTQLDRSLIEMLVPFVILAAITFMLILYLEAIFSSAWIGRCNSIIAMFITVIPVACGVLLMDFLHTIFFNWIKQK